jgi:hypothetical protein
MHPKFLTWRRIEPKAVGVDVEALGSSIKLHMQRSKVPSRANDDANLPSSSFMLAFVEGFEDEDDFHRQILNDVPLTRTTPREYITVFILENTVTKIDAWGRR